MDNNRLDMVIEPPRIAKEWFNKGKAEKDVVFAFICYWITFNQLYSYYAQPRLSERGMVEDFIRQHRNSFKSLIDMSDPIVDVFLEAPVLEKSATAVGIDWTQSEADILDNLCDKIGNYYSEGESRSIMKRHIRLIDEDNNKLDRIIVLFMYIYQVRCNLFHGNKTPTPKRDWRLVESSSQILGTVLPTLIFDVFGQSVND